MKQHILWRQLENWKGGESECVGKKGRGDDGGRMG